MLEIRNIQTVEGKRTNLFIQSSESKILEAGHLTLFPALIDPHVHFRTPGAEHKENWETAAKAALAGGVTTVLDMPNNTPACITKKRLHEKIRIIDEQLKKANIPLRYGLYFGADALHLEEMRKARNEIVGLKIYMGSSTGDLLMNSQEALEIAFRIAAENQILVAVHAEDEELIQLRSKEKRTDPAYHSIIRDAEVAERAVDLAIKLAEKYGTRLYIVHVSTLRELSLIRSAKQRGLPIYAEATPHHLFLNVEEYQRIGTFALVNPPLREKKDSLALFEAIHDGTIDTIGTDHAPHTIEEKRRPYGSAPSGFPSIELYFPLLLNAYNEQKLTLKEIVSLTRLRPQQIFHLPPNDDWVLVDLKKKRKVDDVHLKTKAKWSPYAGRTLQGWPEYVILRSKIYDLANL